MAEKNIEQAPGGEKAIPAGTEVLPISDGVNDFFIQIANLIIRKIRETSGPTNLSMGSVADGEFLKRSGTSIIGQSTVGSLPRGFLWGLTLSNNVTDPTNDIDIAAGKARDTDDSEDMSLVSGITKQLDFAWAVGSGSGMLDTGAVGNNTYHIFLIKRTDTGVVDVLASLSASSPTMPTNYDKKRRIGSIIRASGAIRLFKQDGDDFTWDTPAADVNATNPGTSAVTRTLTVPGGIRVKAKLYVVAEKNDTSGSNLNGVYISDLSITDNAASDSVGSIYQFVTVTVSGFIGAMVECYTNTSSQVRSRLQTSGTNSILRISTNGWVDTRGRLN